MTFLPRKLVKKILHGEHKIFTFGTKGVSIVIYLMSYFTNSAYAFSSESVFSEISSGMFQCTAYYAVGTYCGGDKLDAASRRNIDASMSAANDYAIKFGKQAGLSNQALLARSKLSPKSLMNEMDGNCVNFAVLLSKYGESCKSLVERPDLRFEELVNSK